MKRFIFIILFLVGCGGSIQFKEDGRALYKNGALSCLGGKCCINYDKRYKNGYLICNEANFVPYKSDSINIKIYLEKIKKPYKGND